MTAFPLALAPGSPADKRSASGARVDAVAQASEHGLGVALAAGEWLSSPMLRPGAETQLEVELAGPNGARVLVEYQLSGDDTTWSVVGVAQLSAGLPQGAACWSLRGLAGRDCRFRLRRTDTADGAAVVALADYEFRLANEVSHFSGAAYQHAMYRDSNRAYGGVVKRADNRRAGEAKEALLQQAMARLEAMPARPNEASYDYAHRALGALLPAHPPDFLERAHAKSDAGPLRVLSIMAGAARIEELMLAHCPGHVELTLMDASEDLIQRAAGRLAGSGERRTIHCLVGDVNEGLTGDEPYDLIVCVSALHHVADLETVLGEVNRRLAPHGEFWSVGEQVGRNGNRLWPEALAAANEVFRTWPERLRLNAHTGQVDDGIPDSDFSRGCFEGIRSEELSDRLQAHLVPVEVDLRNAFLWRLVDATYCDNFRLASAEDLLCLRRMVAAEAAHWASGGRGTELNGIYRKKYLR
jgi:SAM-dependent methyltransferase